ncbi:MAG: hypothetical protein M1515_02770 [Candidatus Thermoplasmatota archaeon]|nr:hypothetical protein [Candidatus Thermoplasmatota archaeon]
MFHFIVVLFYGLIAAAIIVAVVCAIRLGANLKATPKTPIPDLQVSR